MTLSSTHINGNHTKKPPQQQSESELIKHHWAKLNIETKTMGAKRLEKMKLNTCSNNNLKPKSITRKEVLHAATVISSPKASHQEALHAAVAISRPQASSGRQIGPWIAPQTNTYTSSLLCLCSSELPRPLPPLRFPLRKWATKKICFCKRKGSGIRMHNN